MADVPSTPGGAARLFDQAGADLEAIERALARQGSAAGAAAGAASRANAPAEDRLREVMRLARSVTSILELQPLLESVVEAFVAITGAERGFLMLRGATGLLEFCAGHNLDAGTVRAGGFAISQAPIQEAAASGRGVYVDDILAQGQYGTRDSVVALELRSFACVPLVGGGRVLGVCYTDSRQRGRPLDEHERALLESFAAQASLAIENARRHDALLQEKTKLEAENHDLRRLVERRYRFTSLLGESEAMQRLFATLEKVSTTAVNVLLQGETGTGKELLARAIHLHGPLRDAPFLTVNAGALPEALLESELFGHRKGAFTGAVADRKGLFEEVHGGTLFLDEVGEMTPALQVKLLRVLQEGEIKPVGDNAVRTVNVRVIAATNRDLGSEVRAGRFREDLYYRLNVVGIRVPPLRERGNDILLLAEEFARRFAKRHGRRVAGIEPTAARWLLGQKWEGNVRQLQNCIERAVTLCEPGAALGLDLLQTPWIDSAAGAGPVPTGTLHQTLAAVEGDEVRKALAATGGRVTAAAAALGVSRQHLHNLMRKHGILTRQKSKT
jgi:transcriptional regulator with GAF, ATPase, and Fis domain